MVDFFPGAFVMGGFSRGGQMFFRLNVVSTNCYVGQMSVGQLSCRPNVCRPIVASAKCRVGQMSCRPNVVSAKCRVGKMSCRPNVCRPNAVSAKSLSAKCRVGQMSVGQISVEGWLLVSVLQCSRGMLYVSQSAYAYLSLPVRPSWN